MPTTIEVNSENWPVNIVTVRGNPDTPVEHATAEELCAVLRSFTSREEPYANIVDLTQCGSVPSKVRRFVADKFNEDIELYRRYLVAVAVIVPSRVMRGVLTAIGWVHPYPSRMEFVSSIADGERTLEAILAERGIAWQGLRPIDRIAERPPRSID